MGRHARQRLFRTYLRYPIDQGSCQAYIDVSLDLAPGTLNSIFKQAGLKKE
jgi:hypothetical protein